MSEEYNKDKEKAVKEHLEIAGDNIKEVVYALDSSDSADLDAAIGQLMQHAGNLDVDSMLNTIVLPDCDKEYEKDFIDILSRIPRGWGRFISCDKGWFPLIVDAHRKLKTIDDNYEIHQIKEKYGSLRFYCALSETFWYPVPRPVFSEEEVESKGGWSKCYAQWNEERDLWEESDEGKQFLAEQTIKSDLFDKITNETETKSEEICEICGEKGEMSYTMGASPWMKTLCEEHRKEKEMIVNWQEWWEEEGEALYEDFKRKNFIERNHDKRNAVIGDNVQELVVEASYFCTEQEAREAAHQEWDNVFLGNNKVSDVYVEELSKVHLETVEKNKQTEKDFQQRKIKSCSMERFENSPIFYWYEQQLRTPEKREQQKYLINYMMTTEKSFFDENT